MGVLSQMEKIFQAAKKLPQEKISPQVQSPEATAVHPPSSAATRRSPPQAEPSRESPWQNPSPCQACGSCIFWLCVYDVAKDDHADGSSPGSSSIAKPPRCWSCEPPPGRSLVHAKLLLVNRPVDPDNPGGPWRPTFERWSRHFDTKGNWLWGPTEFVDEQSSDAHGAAIKLLDTTSSRGIDFAKNPGPSDTRGP